MKRLFLALAALFAWERREFLPGSPYEGNVWAYYENTVNGRRKAVRRISGGHQPIAFGWLREGTKWRVVGQYPIPPSFPRR